jgi:hypothetical protein
MPGIRDENGGILVLLKLIERIRAAIGAYHLATGIFQHVYDDVEDAGILVDNQYSMAHRTKVPPDEGINARCAPPGRLVVL